MQQNLNASVTQLDRSDFLLNIIFNIEGNTRMIKSYYSSR